MVKLKKVMLVFGTRPEAIKMAPLVHKLKSEPDTFEVKICVTAQHREMLDQVLKIFEIKPDIDLNIMKSNQGLFDITTNVLQGMKTVLADNKPNILLVHGDTTTTLAAAMAGFYAGVPVGHIEAGLRTLDMYSPYPEEFNRQVVSKIAKWHFSPTKLSRKNLISENINKQNITVTGNTVIDSLHWVLARIQSDVQRSTMLNVILNQTIPFDWKVNRFVIITFHRRENFGEGINQICEALSNLATKFNDVHFVCPLHFNPNIRKTVQTLLQNLPNIHLIEPMGYEPFIYLLKYSFLVLTDSGGLQEEAPSLGKPVLVMRNMTERPEAVTAGTIELVGTSKHNIIESVTRLMVNETHYKKMSRSHNPYGDGKACDRILQVLQNS